MKETNYISSMIFMSNITRFLDLKKCSANTSILSHEHKKGVQEKLFFPLKLKNFPSPPIIGSHREAS